mmetsp:Transcript_36099/g.60853  ORF Transcript_36099/g.60853 Transcript_36099/m.60853 type:complete len:219 (+) Transcript_36099:603-1259(+)
MGDVHRGSLSVQLVVLVASLTSGCWALPRAWGTNLVDSPSLVLRTVVLLHSAVTIFTYSLGPMRDQSTSVTGRFARGAFGLAAGAVLFHLVAVLYGAPIGDKDLNTHLFGWLLSCLIIAPSACVLGWNGESWRRLYARAAPAGLKETALCIPAHGAVLGAWVGAWPIPLDWERPWQVWPITCTVGALLGHVAALGVTSIVAWRRYSPNTDINHKLKHL